MSFWGKVLTGFKALLKAALALVIFVLAEYVVFTVFALLQIDYKVYKGTYNTFAAILCVAAMLIIHKICSKKEPLIRFNKLSIDQVIALIIIGMGMLGFVSIYLIVTDKIAESMQRVEEAMEEYRDNVDRYVDVPQVLIPVWDSFLYIITLSFIVPFSEEFTFRGAVYGHLNRVFGVWVSVIMSALIFGLMHGVSVHIGYALVCGAVMATCYYLTDSIFASVILHMVFNIFGSGIPNVFEIDQLGIPASIANKIMLATNTACMIFLPISVLAIAYLVIVKRKKEAVRKLAGENISFGQAEDKEETVEVSEVEAEE